jgi:hypothetical protein
MEINISTIISIISVVFCILTFALNRRDKAVKDTKDVEEESSNQKLIDYRLQLVEKKLDKVLDLLDSYDKEIDERVNKALEQHIKIYHKG